MQRMGWQIAKYRNKHAFSLVRLVTTRINTGFLWELCKCCLTDKLIWSQLGHSVSYNLTLQLIWIHISWTIIFLLYLIGIDWQVQPPRLGSSIPSSHSTNKPLHFNTSIANLVILRGKDMHSVDLGKKEKHSTIVILFHISLFSLQPYLMKVKNPKPQGHIFDS